MTGDKIINTTLRLPRSLRELVITAADASNRSMNSELLVRLDYAVHKDLCSPVECLVNEEIQKTKLRVAAPFHEKLTALAKATTFEGNGFNDEVMRRLQGSFDAGPAAQQELKAIRQDVDEEDLEYPNHGNPWTDEDKQFLRDNIMTMSYSEMAKHLGRTSKGVRSQCRFMGLKKKAATVWYGQDLWSSEDDDLLRQRIDDLSYEELSTLVNRTIDAVRKRARFLGVGKQLRARDKQTYLANEAFIKANYMTMTHQAMADALGVDKWDVSRICTRRRFIKEGMWTDEQDQLLMSLLAKGMPYKQIATHCPGRTESAVFQRCRVLKKTLTQSTQTKS
ncbi:Arc family DNA-binding protein [Aeromonas hydrophila]|uniref:Arc family DNA-binding protein n=1 Tax=Aeromonas hydrophila TaxID=644 RepID=UPI002B484693|nr:Arc family DNA-binding protein [Aeromonas hydrophila]